MSAHLILQSSWVAYNEYKSCIAQHPDTFLPHDTWEVRFLMDKIREHYPQYTPMVIELSIHAVKRTLYAGCKRSLFVQLVLANLLQRKPLIVYA